MKRIKLILVCGLVLALAGLTTLLVAAGAPRGTKATVRSVVGDVTYQAEGSGPFLPLRVNQELTEKTVLKSGPGANAYLQVNGFTSTVRLAESTTVTLATMTATGPGLAADTSTDLKLDGGSLLGSVRKLSANSDYKVSVPNGVAGIRGTDFQVSVNIQANGTITIVFTSVTGTVFCQVNPPAGSTAAAASRTLTTGQSWTVTGTATVTATGTTYTTSPLVPVVNLTPAENAALQTAITSVINIGLGGGATPGGGGRGGPPAPPPPVAPVAPTTNPSDTGGNGP